MWEWKSEDEAYDELYHHGIMGMKWGVRRLFYKTKSADQLKKSAAGIQRDIGKLEAKVARRERKAMKKMSRGNYGGYAKWMGKAAKRKLTIAHNKRLLELYRKRLSEIDPNYNKAGREYANLFIM